MVSRQNIFPGSPFSRSEKPRPRPNLRIVCQKPNQVRAPGTLRRSAWGPFVLRGLPRFFGRNCIGGGRALRRLRVSDRVCFSIRVYEDWFWPRTLERESYVKLRSAFLFNAVTSSHKVRNLKSPLHGFLIVEIVARIQKLECENNSVLDRSY